MTSRTSTLNAANAAYGAGDFARAVALYEQAMAENPDLAPFYQLNLDRARQRLCMLDTQEEKVSGRQAEASTDPSLPDASNRPTVSLADLYREADAVALALNSPLPTPAPLVSVLMTAHDVAAYIEQAITSVLRQSWSNLEVIVVDDASTDGTWRILQRLKETDERLRCWRLNTNLGTYFAKNLALREARGAFVFFQDGDDLSHPERIRLGMVQLMRPGVMGVRGAYSRVSFPSERVLPVNGLISKLGLITLGVRREVAEAIGYFNCTTKASDEEWFERLRAYAARHGGVVADISAPTYYNALRPDSLFADMVANDPAADGHIEQRLSVERTAYAEAFRQRHRELGVEGFKAFFRFPVLRDRIPVGSGMSLLPNPRCPVVVSLCSIPEREALLRRTLETLVDQVDAVHLYLDRYPSVPEFVWNSHPKVRVVRSAEVPGLRDNGKFLPFAALDMDCYFLTADDDILYPPDYAAALIERIEHYGRKAVIGVHGVLVPERAERYFSAYRKVLLFSKALERDALVNNLGSGTLGCHASLLRGLGLGHFPTPGMADLYLSLFCKQRGIPMIALARHANWLVEQPSPNATLFDEHRNADEAQSALIRGHRPWGYAAIETAVSSATSAAPMEIAERLRALMPVLGACLR